ncbi:MAG TPA: protein translocase subunit SecD [Acidimicrobiales bacterium]|jgi:preprotein translocase subunit SecD|nr:protein translocase subunit SecD [Acidimicrobiales bacterium]
MRRSLTVSLAVIILGALVVLGATLASGNSPQLGLDLQGGASVVLQPKNKVPSGTLNQAISIIRSRVDALGVAEPDITRQGDSIIVQLPGVKNKDRALEIVGQTAQLYFRPVVQALPPEGATPTTVPPTTQPGSPPTSAPAPTDVPTTPSDKDDPAAQVVLPQQDSKGRVTTRYALGPAAVKGQAISSAKAVVDPNSGGWSVNFSLSGDGEKDWNTMATKVGVNGQIAIDLDGVVKSAPALQTTNFQGSGTITGNFTESEAKDLALVLSYGSLPVQLVPQTVQTVSASLGKDSLHAGLIAGIVGLSLVALYMLLYYRALGLVVWFGLALSGAYMYAIVTYLGQHYGLALSLSGAVGIIVSVGVTVDSYVVYFERLKDEIRSGKTVRSSVDRGFARAYRTILAADAASFIGAVVLYLLSVGSVRGFAFFLGLSTLLDVFIAYFYTRPMVVLLGRNRFFTETRWVGVARGLASPQVAAPPAKVPA